MPANFYYLFELHEPQNRLRAHEHIHRGHLKKSGGLYKRLYRSSPERKPKASILNDKLALDELLRARDLPATRCIAVVANGIISYTDAGWAMLPPMDPFVKPRDAYGGKGTER